MAYLGEYHINANTKGYYKFDNNLNDSSGSGLTLSYNTGGTWGPSYDYHRIGSHGYYFTHDNYLYRNDNYSWNAYADYTIGFILRFDDSEDTNEAEIFFMQDADYQMAIALMTQESGTYPTIWPRIYKYDSGSVSWTDSSSVVSLSVGSTYFILLRYDYTGTYYDLYLESYALFTGGTNSSWRWIATTGTSYRARVAKFTGSDGSRTDYTRIFPPSSDTFYVMDDLFIENRLWTTPSPDFINYWQINRAVNRPRCS